MWPLYAVHLYNKSFGKINTYLTISAGTGEKKAALTQELNVY
jgi:hypothetical protein